MDLNFIVFVRKVFAIKRSFVIRRSILKHKIVVKTIVNTEILYFFQVRRENLNFSQFFRIKRCLDA